MYTHIYIPNTYNTTTTTITISITITIYVGSCT